MNKVLTKILKVVILSIAVFCASAVYAGAFEDGVAAYYKKNYAVALSKFKLAAAQGVALAQFNLGIMYSNGEGVVQDYAEAVKWYKLAAAKGDALTLPPKNVSLAERLNFGQGERKCQRESGRSTRWSVGADRKLTSWGVVPISD